MAKGEDVMLSIEWLDWIFICLGLIYMVTHSAIFTMPRVWIASFATWLEVLLYCPACTGTWVGLFLVGTGTWPGDTSRPFQDLVAGMLAGTILGVLWGAVQVKLTGASAHTHERAVIQQIRDYRYALTHPTELAKAAEAGAEALRILDDAKKVHDAAQAQPDAEG